MHVISSRNITIYLSILQKVIGEDTVDTTFSFCEVIRSDPIRSDRRQFTVCFRDSQRVALCHRCSQTIDCGVTSHGYSYYSYRIE